MAEVRRETWQNGILVNVDTVTVPDQVIHEQTLGEQGAVQMEELRAVATSTGTLTTAQLSTTVRLLARVQVTALRLLLRRFEGTT